MTKLGVGIMVALLGLAIALVAVPAGIAKNGDIRVRGTCTKASTSKLKLSEEDGRIEVEFEVDQNRNGVRWNVVIRPERKPARPDDARHEGAEWIVRGARGCAEHLRQGHIQGSGDEPVRRGLHGASLLLRA